MTDRHTRLLSLTASVCALVMSATAAPNTQDNLDPLPLSAQPFFFALSVSDLEVSVAWYERVLGFSTQRRVSLDERGIRVGILTGQGALLELVEDARALDPHESIPSLPSRARIRGIFKIGFKVDDLDAALTQLGTLGVEQRGNIITEADRSLRSAQIEDPDGNIVQLFEHLPPPPRP